MVCEIVKNVKSDHKYHPISVVNEEQEKAQLVKSLEKKKTEKKARKKAESKKTPPIQEPSLNLGTPVKANDELIGNPCPLCGKGHIIKGRTAYGCSEWKNGCKWVAPFD